MTDDIYQPQEDSYLLQKHLKKYALGRILDMGTGSGIQALTILTNPNIKEVLAVDINPKVVEKLNQKINQENLRKIKTVRSDLFENVQGKFNLIIFNPPYLPQDKNIEGKDIKDEAIYGGKNGWELSEKFFRQASNFLFPDGKILFLFSSLTNKEKIDEILKHNLFDFKEIDRQKLSFETLYVYLIEKSPPLKELERKGIENITYFTHGKRGDIYTGFINQNQCVKTYLSKEKEIIKVAIKIKRKESEAIGKIENEAKWLKILNQESIGPKYLFHDDNFLVYKFVEGKFILDWIEGNDKENIKNVLIELLNQCFTLDKMKVNKEEMHHPLKHILVDKFDQPILIDFERCNQTEKPQNVTQFIEFICRMKSELKKKSIVLRIENLRNLAKSYKEKPTLEKLDQIIAMIK